MGSELALTPADRRLLAEARRATLGTIAGDGSPRLVPICFVVHASAPILYSPLDDKPKRVADPRDLARVRDIVTDARVTVLVDRWDEDWSRLAWLRCEGLASLVEPVGDALAEHADAVRALRARYGQYLDHDLAARPMLRIDVTRASRWGAL
jgi:PPOX class probable F420-dependent enzyme